MERFRGDPALAGYYQELEEKHGIKAHWYSNGNYVIPKSYPESYGDLPVKLLKYIKQPALVDKFRLNENRAEFWLNYIQSGCGRSDKFNIYHENRLRFNQIMKVRLGLDRINKILEIKPRPKSLVESAHSYILDFETAIAVLGDGYQRNITLPEVDTITDKIYDVVWALAEK